MINRVVLVGRLARDPELRKTNSGDSVASFTVAVDNWGKTADGNKNASFIPCTAFRQPAETITKFARKGSLVGVEGRLNQRNFTRKDGTNASVIEVTVDNVRLLEPKSANANADATPANTDSIQDTSFDDDANNLEGLDLTDDALPF